MGALGGLIVFLICFEAIDASTVCMPEEDIWRHVGCKEHFTPDNCDFDKLPLVTLADYDRCGPANLSIPARNMFLGAAGRGFTKQANRDAFNRIDIIPKMLRDINDNNLEISVLNQRISMPIGISPAAYQKLAHPDGELATAAAAVNAKTVMILSSYSSVSMEAVAKVAEDSEAHLWMQLYKFKDRNHTVDIVHKAEKFGFKALVFTVDSSAAAQLECDPKDDPEIQNLTVPNLPGGTLGHGGPLYEVTTFKDIKWLKSLTKLPIVAKGILRGEDAKMAIEYGASAIFVSNHGGRRMDYAPATIDALPGVVDAVRNMEHHPDVYLDGGVRNGYDVYKAMARGANMVFIGRPSIWGLALGGTKGVEDVLNILRKEFNETMLLAGASHPGEIWDDTISPRVPPIM